MTGAAAPDPYPEGHPERWKVLGVLCAALCIVVLDNTILAVAVPSLGEALGANEADLQWITAAYGLVLAALLLPLAGLGDRFGRKGLLMVGVVIFGLSSAGAAFAATTGQLTVARGLMGLGGAATMPATLAVLGNVFPDHERGRAIAIWSGVSAIAGAAGPIVGGFLLAHFWWGSVFLVNVPVTLAVLAAAARLVPDSKDPATPPIDWLGSLVWTAALALLLFAFIEGGEQGWTSPVVVGPILGGLALLGAFAWWERRTAHPLLAPAAVADHRMQAGMVAVPVIFFAVFGTQFILTQWLQGVRGLSPLLAGVCFVPHAVAVLVGSLSSTRMVVRFGLGRTAAGGLLVLAGSLLLAASAHTSAAPVIVALALAGFGVGFACPPGVELIMGSVPPEHAGQAAGVNETIVEAGGAFGIAVLGSVLAFVAGGPINPDALDGAAGAAARQEFTDALAAPFVVAAVVLVVAAAVVLVRTRGTSADRPGSVGDVVSVTTSGVVAAEPVSEAAPAPAAGRVSGAAGRPPAAGPTTGS